MIMFIVSHNCQFSWKWKSFNGLELKISSAKLPVNNQPPVVEYTLILKMAQKQQVRSRPL